MTQRPRVRVLPGPLSSNNLEQVIHTRGAQANSAVKAIMQLAVGPLVELQTVSPKSVRAIWAAANCAALPNASVGQYAPWTVRRSCCSGFPGSGGYI